MIKIREASEPSTVKASLFSEAIETYAEEIVRGNSYIEEHYFKDADSLDNFFYSRVWELGGTAPFKPIGYVPEKVDFWIDGKTTILVNEDFLSKYQTIEGLEGIAMHALFHADYESEKGIMTPSTTPIPVSYLNGLFPVNSLNEKDKIELWTRCINIEHEVEVVRRSIEKSPYSAIAEDFEINMIIFNHHSENLERDIKNIDDIDIDELKDVSKRNFLLSTTRFSTGKDVAFLTTSVKAARDYKQRWIRRRKEKEKQLINSISFRFPEHAEVLESFRISAEAYMDSLSSLISERKPQTKEDLADMFTTFLNSSKTRI